MGRCSDARDRLLGAAASLVHARGYSAVSVADICKEAGLKKGSFYHFFPSKRDLVLATIDAFAEHHRASVKEAMVGEGSAREKLRRMFAGMSAGMMQCYAQHGVLRGCPLGNLALEMGHRDAAIRDKLREVFGEWQKGLADLLRAGVERGEMKLSDPELVSETLVAFAEGSILLAKTANDPGVFARLTAGALAIVDGAEARDVA